MISSGLWGTADQVLISAVSFVTMALLARGVGPAQFGIYTLVYMSFLMANGVQQSLVTQPHNTIGPSLTVEEFPAYTASTAAMQLLVLVGLSVLTVSIASVLRIASWEGTGTLVAMVPALWGWQSQELMRRVQYTRGIVRAAMANDLLAYGTYTLGVGFLYLTDGLTTARAFLAMATAHAIAAAWAGWQLREQLLKRPVSGYIRANWDFGKWLVGSGLITSAGNMVSASVMAVMLGPQALGATRTVQNLVAPTQILGSVYSSLFGPLAAREHAHRGTGRMLSLLWKGAIVLVGLSAAYLIVLVVFSAPVISFVYSDEYVGFAWTIWFYVAAYLLTFVTLALSLAMRVLRHTRVLFRSTLVGVVTNLLLIVPLTMFLDLGGALSAGVIGQVITAGLVHGSFVQALRLDRNESRE